MNKPINPVCNIIESQPEPDSILPTTNLFSALYDAAKPVPKINVSSKCFKPTSTIPVREPYSPSLPSIFYCIRSDEFI